MVRVVGLPNIDVFMFELVSLNSLIAYKSVSQSMAINVTLLMVYGMLPS